jgi:hypothetical protein
MNPLTTVSKSLPPIDSRESRLKISIVDLNALAWLEDYLQTWPGTLLVVYVLLFL